jgi:kynurenine formamidase
MNGINHHLSIDDQIFRLGPPLSISRTISLKENNLIDAFYLPTFESTPVKIHGFVGDVSAGGSCNVNLLSFTPHNLTHIEMSSHISHHGASLDQRPLEFSSGILQVIDISEDTTKDKLVTKRMIAKKVSSQLPFTMLGLKTSLSLRNSDPTFSGTDPLALAPETTKFISTKYKNVHTLILDLPSADKEEDGGKLLAHRNFFEIPEQGLDFTDIKHKSIVELANFDGIEQGFYYAVVNPFKIDLDAMVLDIIIRKLEAE